MFAVFLFVVVFGFYYWLFSIASENKCIPKGWGCVEPTHPDLSWKFVEGRSWAEDICPLGDHLRKLLSLHTIRELKHFASERHIHGYGNMTKAQLIEALAA